MNETRRGEEFRDLAVLALEYVLARQTLLYEALRAGDLDDPADDSELLIAARNIVRAVNHLGPAHFPEGWLS